MAYNEGGEYFIMILLFLLLVVNIAIFFGILWFALQFEKTKKK